MVNMNFPYQVIDLTHTLKPKMPSWNGGCGFSHSIKLDYTDRDGELGFRVQQIKVHAGIGTHIDAPAHCIPNGATIAELELKDLISPCVVIDVKKSCHPRYSVTAKDITAHEQKFGTIPAGSLVIINTGWGIYWSDPAKYRNNLVFPDVTAEAAELLLQRGISGLGIDTMSPDRPEDGFPVHAAILGAGKYIVENVANIDQLPPVGSIALALPLKTIDGTEAPTRLIALVENKQPFVTNK